MPNILICDKAPAPPRKVQHLPSYTLLQGHGNALPSRKSPRRSSRTISAFHQHICYHKLNMMWDDMILKCLTSLKMGKYWLYSVSLVFISLCHQDIKFLKGREFQWHHIPWSSLLHKHRLLGWVKVTQGYVGLLVQMISELDLWLTTALGRETSFISGRAVSRTLCEAQPVSSSDVTCPTGGHCHLGQWPLCLLQFSFVKV